MDALKLMREITRIAGHDVVRPSGRGTFQDHIVVRVASHVEPLCRGGQKGTMPNRPDRSGNRGWIQIEARPQQHLLIFPEEHRGYYQLEPAREAQFEDQSLLSSLFQMR